MLWSFLSKFLAEEEPQLSRLLKKKMPSSPLLSTSRALAKAYHAGSLAA